jgi:hypothetical protein
MDRLDDVDPRVRAPFSKDDARLVQVATRTADNMLAGMRAGETIEKALRSENTVAVPILNAETGEVTLLMQTDWLIPTGRHGQFRAVVE